MLSSKTISYCHFGEDGCLHLLGGPKSLKTIAHHISECNFHQQCCKNLKSNTETFTETPLFSKSPHSPSGYSTPHGSDHLLCRLILPRCTAPPSHLFNSRTFTKLNINCARLNFGQHQATMGLFHCYFVTFLFVLLLT
jgi:hypothetical protein